MADSIALRNVTRPGEPFQSGDTLALDAHRDKKGHGTWHASVQILGLQEITPHDPPHTWQIDQPIGDAAGTTTVTVELNTAGWEVMPTSEYGAQILAWVRSETGSMLAPPVQEPLTVI